MFSEPKHNLEQLMIGEGKVVADFGAGSGHYTIEAARMVGDSGKVYSLDIQKDLLSRIKNLAKENNLHNVEILWADLEKKNGSKIGGKSVDVVIIANVLFQVEDKESFISEAHRVLKDGGKLLFVDWTDSFGGLGPHPEAVVSESKVRHTFEEKGFEILKSIYAGEHHFGIVFKKTK